MPKFSIQSCALAAMAAALIVGCTSPPSREAMSRAVEGYVEDVNKLFVVDCLLPGQLRKLGSQVTYLSARRPVRTTAADCEVRGGEYVAYDRANYASALKVWRPKAEEGDAAAQLYVGEIYEKGLGQPADYREAAKWYRKAAEQGNAQAQINLGHLYEQGLGVAKDQAAAVNWYRKASGLDSANLPFAAATEAAEVQRQELEILRQTTERQRQETQELRSELRSTRERLLQQQDALRRAQDELDELRTRIREEKSVPKRSDDTRLRQLEEELHRKEAQLKAQQSQLGAMTASLTRERQAMRREEAARAAPNPPPTSTGPNKPAQKAPASETREKLAEAENALIEKLADYQAKSAELTQLLTQPQDGGEAQKRITESKQSLLNRAREIAALKQQVEQYNLKLAGQASPEVLAQAGPRIEILEPAVASTRGLPAIRIAAGTQELVGRIEAPEGLRSLFVDNQPRAVDASGIFRAPIEPNRQDPFTIVATDNKQKRTDLTVSLIRETPATSETPPAPKPAGPGETPGGIEFGKFYALIIGNNDYAAYPALKTAVNDAKSVDVVLRERYGFTTTLLFNANRHAIMTALNEIQKRLTEQDNLLIYYAGHGEIDRATQNAYWLPVDAEAGNPANWISSQSITELLSIMPARHVLVVADSCYSGALTGSAVARLPEGIDESKRAKWLKIMATRKARTVLTSGGVAPVLDEGGGGHSVFANAFLRVLRSNQRVLEDYDIFGEVSRQVKSSASRVGFEQMPQYAPLQHAGHEGSPFFFVPEAV